MLRATLLAAALAAHAAAAAAPWAEAEPAEVGNVRSEATIAESGQPRRFSYDLVRGRDYAAGVMLFGDTGGYLVTRAPSGVVVARGAGSGEDEPGSEFRAAVTGPHVLEVGDNARGGIYPYGFS